MIDDLVDVLLVDIPIVNGQSDAVGAEAARSADPVQVVLRVSAVAGAARQPLRGHVVVDDQLCLRDVDAASDHVGRDEHVDLGGAEPADSLITLSRRHLAEHDVARVASVPQGVVYFLGKVLGVHEDERLRHLAGLKDLFDEIELGARLATVHELPNVGQLQLLGFDLDLRRLLDEVRDASLHCLVLVVVLRRVRGRE